MIRTLVVEDDPHLADAHSQYVARVPGFHTVGVVHTGGEALRFVAQHEVDLILLDFYLPDITGLRVCQTLRAHARPVDVIAVTSARDVAIVRSAVAQGVIQYLLKPFTFATFRDKLERYAEYRHALSGPVAAVAGQQDVDRALSALRTSRPAVPPKGMSKATLDVIEQRLRDAPAGLSAAGLAMDMGISRVTSRRYLEYLTDQQLATRTPRYGTTGRPEHIYRWTAQARQAAAANPGQDDPPAPDMTHPR